MCPRSWSTSLRWACLSPLSDLLTFVKTPDVHFSIKIMIRTDACPQSRHSKSISCILFNFLSPAGGGISTIQVSSSFQLTLLLACWRRHNHQLDPGHTENFTHQLLGVQHLQCNQNQHSCRNSLPQLFAMPSLELVCSDTIKNSNANRNTLC